MMINTITTSLFFSWWWCLFFPRHVDEEKCCWLSSGRAQDWLIWMRMRQSTILKLEKFVWKLGLSDHPDDHHEFDLLSLCTKIRYSIKCKRFVFPHDRIDARKFCIHKERRENLFILFSLTATCIQLTWNEFKSFRFSPIVIIVTSMMVKWFESDHRVIPDSA